MFHRLRSYEASLMVMGTLGNAKLWHTSQTKARRACQEIFRIWQDIDETMSLYKPTSDLVALNNHAGKGLITVAPSLIQVLEKALEYSQKTHGLYDMNVGTLMDYWGLGVDGDKFRTRSLRGAERGSNLELRSATGFRPRLFLYPSLGKAGVQSGAKIDLGGIAKGYALDKAGEVLCRAHIERAILDLGGQLFLFNPPAEGWSIGVREPGDVQKIVGTLRINKTCSIGVSSQEDQFIQKDGEALGHVMDPRNGRPVSQGGSVSVMAATAIQADALSTAFLIASAQEISDLVRDFPGVEVLRITPTENDDWQYWRSPGMPFNEIGV